MSSVSWNILCWNARDLNSDVKCLALRNKVDVSGCSIICLQETKKESFDHSFIRKCCPRRFDKFEFIPSIGASGGIIIIWCSSQFSATMIHKEQFVLTLELLPVHDTKKWRLSNVYGPCEGPERNSLLIGFITYV